jgi:hypothetical protein
MHLFRVFVVSSGLLLAACGTSSQGPCNANTCQGCCNAAGKCEAGNTAGACGALGGMCRDCSGLGLTCTLGSCSTVFTGAGGGSSSGGGGGSMNADGGMTGGGGGSTTGGGGGAMTGGGGGSTTGGGGGAMTGGGGGTSVACNVNNGGCAAEAICTPQGASRVCTCNTGYVGDGFTCSDVNECLSGNGGCASNASCTNTNGGRTCACPVGFTGDGVTCTDVNECLVSNGGCSVNADCTNTMGSRTCACRSGFTGDGVTCSASTPTWSVEVVAVSGGSTSSLAFTASGEPAIAYTSDSPRGVYYRARLGANSWSAAETVDASTNAMWPSMVYSAGLLVSNSVLTTSSGSVGTARRNPTWIQESIRLLSTEQPSLAVANGREHLVSNSRVAGQPSIVQYVSRPSNTNSWSSNTNISTTAGWSPAKLSATASGELGVLYTRNTDTTLWFARSSGLGTSWSSTQVTTTAAWSYDLVLAASQVTYIAYYQPGTHTVVLETWVNASRSTTTTVDTPGGTAPGSQWFSGVSIALDAAGFVHLSYLDFTRGTPALRYATNKTGSMVAETVTTSDDVLGETSIAVDSSGAPHISFPSPSSSFGNLGYAVKR